MEARKLNEEEERETQERLVAPARIVHEVILREGYEELERTSSALAWSGFAAGFSMGLSLMAEGVLYLMVPEVSWKHLIVALGYPVGFVALITSRQQLFTENTLRAVVPFLAKPDRATFANVARLWVVVLASNLVGGWLFALLLAKTPAFDPDLHSAFTSIGTEIMSNGFWQLLVKAIFAGWIIALMSWMLSSAVHNKLAVIFLMTYLIGVARLTHVIAGSVDTLYLVWSGATNYGDYLFRFFLPTLIGNVLGGVLLVSIVNHAQVTAGGAERRAN